MFLAAASGISFLVSKWFEVSFWLAFIIITVAILTVGWIAFVEDKMPGGFDNPKGQEENKQKN